MGVVPPAREKTKVAGFFADGLYYARVREVASFPYEGTVHNFRTTSGEYIAGGLLVHNCFGHWHRDQGIVTLDGRTFMNQGAVSRGALIKENLERKPKVGLIEITPEGIVTKALLLDVPPASEVFDIERKERQDEQTRHIDQFVLKLQADLQIDPEASIETTLSGMTFAAEIRDLALHYLENARLKKVS
jgi:hypothetical protein